MRVNPCRAGQRDEARDVDLLGPHRRIEPGGGDKRAEVEAAVGGEALQ